MARGTHVIKVLLFVGAKAFLSKSLDTHRLRYPMPGADLLSKYLGNLDCEFEYFDFDAYLINQFKTKVRCGWNDIDLNHRMTYQITKKYDYVLFSLPRYEHNLTEMRDSVVFAYRTLQELRRLQQTARIIVGGLSWSCTGDHPREADLVVRKHDVNEADLARILGVKKVRDNSVVKRPFNAQNFNYQNHLIYDFFQFTGADVKYPYGWVKQTALKFVDGCTSNCAFCVEWGNKVRIKPFNEIQDMIKRAYFEHGCNAFYFLNTAINPNRKFTEKLCNWMIRTGIRAYWSDSVKFHDTDREFFDMLYDAGCRSLCFGAEVVDDSMLDYIDKGLTVKDIQRGIINSHEAGIWNVVNFITGMPCETKESVDNTINFIKEYRECIDRAVINRFYMKKASGFYQNNERYGLKFIRPREYIDDMEFNVNEFGLPGGSDIMYWETNGRNLYDVYQQRKNITDEMFSEINDGKIQYDVSQHLLFALYSEYHSKNMVKEQLDKYFYPKLEGTLPLVKYRYSD
jgi:radical SAM superfamily enzyme YgiQ (UPF0313 family)